MLLALIPMLMPIAPVAAAQPGDRGSTSRLRWLLAAGVGAFAAYFATRAPESTGLVTQVLPDATAGSSSLTPLSGIGQAPDPGDAAVWASLARFREMALQIASDGDESGAAAFEFRDRLHRSNYVVGLNELVALVADGSQEARGLRHQAYVLRDAESVQAREPLSGVVHFYDEFTRILRDAQNQPDAQRPAEVAQSLRALVAQSLVSDEGQDDSGRPATPVRGMQRSARDRGLALADWVQSLENPDNALAASQEYERNEQPRFARMRAALYEADRAAQAELDTQPIE